MKKILVAALMAMLWASGVYAAGTAAGTIITNNASLTYKVGGVAINTTVQSNDDKFVVDDKVDLTVSHDDTVAKPVTPGSTAQVLTFTVTNTGNKTHDFLLTAGQNDGNPFGESHPDQFDATNVHVYVESGANPGYQASEDTDTYIDELAADGSKKVYIVSDIPNPLNPNDVAEMTLTAQVATGGASGTQGSAITSDNSADADTAGAAAGDEQIVFADAAGANSAPDIAKDGKHGDTSAYKVITATLDITKLSCVINDPVNVANNPKRIPGATIAYVFDINNTGNAAADDVVIVDDLASQLDQTNITVQELEANTGNTACTCVDTAGNGTTGTNSTPTNDQTNHDVEINIGTVNAGNHSCLEIRVPIL